MLSQTDKEQILLLTSQDTPLTEELKETLLFSIKNDEPSIFGEGDYLCCDLGIDQPNRYIWTTFDNCRALGGRAADNSMCGR